LTRTALLLAAAALLPLQGQSRQNDPANVLADRIWSGLQSARWDTLYRKPSPGSPATCTEVPPQGSLRSGLNDYAYHCAKPAGELITESFYYPVDRHQPVILLRRLDFRLAAPYPEVSLKVEEALRARLTRRYGTGVPAGDVYEIGATRPVPATSWQAVGFTIFLHRNRTYVAPAGVREGVQLIAIHHELLDRRALTRKVEEAFSSSTTLAHSRVETDLRKELGAMYPAPFAIQRSEAQRAPAERQVRAALLRLLRQPQSGDRNLRAAALVAADDLAVRLGSLLIVRVIANGSEQLSEASNASSVRRQLVSYGVKYTGIGHYSGDLEYDRSLLHRAWKEFPDTPWGQRAFLMLQSLSCADAQFGCPGPACFRQVIRRGEQFLRDHPDTPFRKEQCYHLALAYETWWSLSQARPGDPTAEGIQVDKAAGSAARVRAVELYEELLRISPESPEALMGRLRLPRLRLGLDTGERTFFCFTC
jgi:hypothetical protein